MALTRPLIHSPMPRPTHQSQQGSCIRKFRLLMPAVPPQDPSAVIPVPKESTRMPPVPTGQPGVAGLGVARLGGNTPTFAQHYGPYYPLTFPPTHPLFPPYTNIGVMASYPQPWGYPQYPPIPRGASVHADQDIPVAGMTGVALTAGIAAALLSGRVWLARTYPNKLVSEGGLYFFTHLVMVVRRC